MMQEAHPEAAAILAAAGWKPHDRWGVYTTDTLVMGFSPCGQFFDVKNWALDIHGPDYPDAPVEAAEWLVRLRAPNPLSLGATEPVVIIEEPPVDPVPESQAQDEPSAPEPDSVSGGDETPAGGDAGSAEDGAAGGGGALLAHDGQAWEGDSGVEPDHDYEAEFEEIAPDELTEAADLLELEAPDLGEEILEEHGEQPQQAQGDRFYGLDDIDRRKTVAIGLVMRHAKSLMPFWTTNEDAALAELRNFAMGVAENRWPDDAGRQLELAALETTVRRIREIERARDEKVEFIEAADREAFDAFVVEADWP